MLCIQPSLAEELCFVKRLSFRSILTHHVYVLKLAVAKGERSLYSLQLVRSVAAALAGYSCLQILTVTYTMNSTHV